MVKLQVVNTSGKIIREGTFEDHEAAEYWFQELLESGAIGNAERWIIEDDLSMMKLQRKDAIASESVIVDSNGTTKIKYKFAAEFHVREWLSD